ncbi:MAG: hypothetical protein HWD83_06975 [Gammaproteobacteria bacterium]|nr:hypothetical protein [Gammaproteobacteria bacterium]
MKHSIFLISFVVFMSLCCVVNAQQQGVPGETSTAVTTISISVLPNILITDVQDIYLDIQDRTQDVVIDQDFCVVGNTTGNYVLQASGANNPGAPFQLIGQDGEVLPFEMTFNGDIEAQVDAELAPGIDSPPFELENRGLSCGGAPNARMSITFKAEDLIFASAGVFSGDLALTVAIE